MNVRLFLVDGLNLVRRIYAAQPGEEGPARVRSALSTSLHSLERALGSANPTHAVAVFDGDGPGWRHHLFPDYKAGRSPMPEALAEGLPAIRSAFLKVAGVASVVIDGVEADDVIATLAVGVVRRDGRVRILSSDKNFIQLLSNRVSQRDHFARHDIDRRWVKEKYGVEPEQFVDLFALAGDSTNAIPGVPSIGLKTAARLIAQVGSLDDILAVAHTIPGKAGRMIHDHAETARLARRLLTLKKDVPLGVNLRDFRLKV